MRKWDFKLPQGACWLSPAATTQVTICFAAAAQLAGLSEGSSPS